MIDVTVRVPGQGEPVRRRAQFTSAGPPGINAKWARTCDDQPPEWLLVSEVIDQMTGRTAYYATAGNAGLT